MEGRGILLHRSRALGQLERESRQQSLDVRVADAAVQGAQGLREFLRGAVGVLGGRGEGCRESSCLAAHIRQAS